MLPGSALVQPIQLRTYGHYLVFIIRMKEYLEKIKAQKEAEKAGKTVADKKREERRQLEERIYASSKSKSSQKTKIDLKDEKDREKRILENMRKQQSKSINSNPSRPKNDEYIPSKKSTVPSKPVTPSSSVTSSTLSSTLVSNKIPKKKPRVGEYSPTRPSIISKSHNGNRKVEEYVPSKVNSAKEQKGVNTKSSDTERSKPTPQYIPSPKSKLLKKSCIDLHRLLRIVVISGGFFLVSEKPIEMKRNCEKMQQKW
uniref:Uncharacterized protein n=1 Tax=Tetranychus urticae TaxID=32264 RepID=T1KIV9_TETUR